METLLFLGLLKACTAAGAALHFLLALSPFFNLSSVLFMLLSPLHFSFCFFLLIFSSLAHLGPTSMLWYPSFSMSAAMTYAPIHPPLSTLLDVYSKSSRNKHGLLLPIENFLLNKPSRHSTGWIFGLSKGFLRGDPLYKAGREYNLHGVLSARSHAVRGEGSFILRGVLSGSHF